MNIHTGDIVAVIAGKDKSKQGKVLKVFPATSRVLVEGVHIQKKHQRARKSNEKGQIVEKAYPIHVSNVALLDPKDGKPTRVRFRAEGGKKVRVAHRSGAVIA